MGIEILPPDLNESKLLFAPEALSDGKTFAIRYGLAAIKNVGEAAMAQAIADREEKGRFESVEDFADRLDTKVVNKKIMENLTKGGAFDSLGETRAGLFGRLESVVASASSAQKDRAAGQSNLFDMMDLGGGPAVSNTADAVGVTNSLGEVEEWPQDERLEHEKELLGFYVTGHPLDKFRGVVDSDRYVRIGLLDELDISDRRQRFPFAGMIRSVENKMTKAGKPFGVLTLEDFTGSAELLCWSESYMPARDAGLLEPGKVIALKANVTLDDRTETRRLTGTGLKEIKPARKGKNSAVDLTLWLARHKEADLEKIGAVLQRHPGKKRRWAACDDRVGRRVRCET